MFSFLSSLLGFKKKSDIPDNSPCISPHGYLFFERGNKYFIAQKFTDALREYDLAIEHDIEFAYLQRAMCLQKLEYHYDALRDFDRAISFSPEDSNLYFLRAWSRIAIGNNEGSMSDIQSAAHFGKVENERNKTYYEEFLKSNPNTFHKNIGDFYHSHLAGIEAMATLNELKKKMNKPIEIKQRPSL